MMTRAAAADTVVVKPTSNIYTVLAAVATVVVILGLVVLWVRAGTLFGGLLNDKELKTSQAASSRR